MTSVVGQHFGVYTVSVAGAFAMVEGAPSELADDLLV